MHCIYTCVCVYAIPAPISYYIKDLPNHTTSSVPALCLPKRRVYSRPPAIIPPNSSHNTLSLEESSPPTLKISPREALVFMVGIHYSRVILQLSPEISYYHVFQTRPDQTKYHLITGGHTHFRERTYHIPTKQAVL